MSAKIGDLFTTHNGSNSKIGEVWASRGGVELHLTEGATIMHRAPMDPIAARNAAAVLVRASEEVERMRRHGE